VQREALLETTTVIDVPLDQIGTVKLDPLFFRAQGRRRDRLDDRAAPVADETQAPLPRGFGLRSRDDTNRLGREVGPQVVRAIRRLPGGVDVGEPRRGLPREVILGLPDLTLDGGLPVRRDGWFCFRDAALRNVLGRRLCRDRRRDQNGHCQQRASQSWKSARDPTQIRKAARVGFHRILLDGNASFGHYISGGLIGHP
jgi:hypothetical protein